MDLAKFYDKAYLWILTVGPRILGAMLLLLFGIWLIKIINRWIRNAIMRHKMDASLRPFLLSLTSTILQILLALAVMQVLGIQMTVFAALVGAFGVAAGLALSGTLQNFTGGIIILLLKPYKVGDNIISQAQEGTVNAIRVFYTVMVTYDNKTVIIPNSKLANEVIINLSREGKRRVDIELKLNYGVDFTTIENIIKNVLQQQDYVLKEPTPRIGMHMLEPDGYKILINVWVFAHGFIDNKMKLQQAIIAAIKTNGIKLPGMN